MIPKQQTLLITAALLCFSSINAQFSSFDLSKYKTTDYQRRELVFSGDFSGNYSENKVEDYHSSYLKGLQSNFSFDFNSTKNSRKTQRDILLKAALNPLKYDLSSYHSNSYLYYNNLKEENTDHKVEVTFHSSHRNYFKSNKFFELDVNASLKAGHSKDNDHKIDNTVFQKSDNSSRFLEGNLELPVKIGAGRIENVEDARMAIFILEALQQNSQLSKEVNEEDILLFAEKITQLKNKRHFDSRKRRIYEIQSLDSFMREKGIVNSQNAVYYSNLIDNWGYAHNPNRQAGTRFSMGIAPVLYYNITNNISQQKDSYLSKGIRLMAELKAEKPISLKWQRSAGGTAVYTRSGNRATTKSSGNGEFITKYTSDNVYISAYGGYGFYPDSRSYHEITISPFAGKYWNKLKDSNPDYWENVWNYGANLSLGGYIYFSERLYANYSVYLVYSENKNKTDVETLKSNNFGTSFNLSFAYSIF